MMKLKLEKFSTLVAIAYFALAFIRTDVVANARPGFRLTPRQLAQANHSGSASNDNSKKLAAGIDLKRLSSFLRNGASALGMPATLLIGNASGNSIAVGDFNNDGRADLAVSDAGSGVTWLLRGDGAGGFGPPTRFNHHPGQSVVAVGDFNDDGIEDKVFKNSLSADSTVLFGENADGQDDAGREPTAALVIADFNGDRIADIAVADSASNKVIILTGTRQGVLKIAASIATGVGPARIATGDFNEDGIADLAITNRLSGNVSIILGGKKGAFSSATNLSTGSGPVAIAVDDFNGDDIADLAVVNELSKDVSIFLGDGRGGFSPSRNFAATGESASEKDASETKALVSEQVAAAAPAVISITLNPSSVAGGTGAGSTATVTLSEPAPATGTDISLSSSNTELAVAPLIVNVPAGQTSATFTVSTNKDYRRYSGLSFQAVISAATNGATQSATLTVTAQPRPADINGDSTQREGFVCGGSFPASGGERGILYQCFKGANFGTLGKCKFSQECANGCQSKPSRDGLRFEDVCLASPNFSFLINPKAVLAGASSQGTVLLNSPAPPPSAEVYVTSSSTAVTVPYSISIPAGGAQGAFSIDTTPVPSPVFSNIGINIETQVPQSNGSIFLQHRLKSSWLSVLTSGSPTEPPALFALTIAPSTVIGGNSSQGTVTLTRAAPAEGVAVTLASSNSAIATAPVSVTVAPGASSATFTVTTLPISTANTISITASLGAISKDAYLTVDTARFVSITLNPTSVTGGSASQGTVTLNGPAPAGGALVTLSSNNSTVASVPASVTIAAGATSANFTVTTATVTASTSIFISASYAGVNLPGSLTVTPAGGGGGGDTVAIQRAEYTASKRELRVDATSTSSSAVLRVYVTSTNTLIGTLSNNGGGRYSGTLNSSTNPQNITVKSSLGGQASRNVTLK